MKKVLLVILAITMLAGLFGCGNSNNGGNGGGGNEPAEPVITGKTKDIGRMSVLIPDGWSYVDHLALENGTTLCRVRDCTHEDGTRQVYILFNNFIQGYKILPEE